MSEQRKRVRGRSGIAEVGRAAVGIATLKLRIAIGVVAGLLFLGAMVGLAAVGVSSSTGYSQQCRVTGDVSAELPRRFIPIYERAATHYKLGSRGFSILAAIHKVESGFGQNMGPSSAGGIGHMQFMPSTWAAYGVDADGDGRKDPYDPEDAIFAAARYLRASGAPKNWRAAIFAYNHAGWYVEMVLDEAENYQGTLDCELVGGGAKVDIGHLNWNDTSGAWGGSKKFAMVGARLGKRFGCSITSAKRDIQSTASGGVSDHWVGAEHSYAVDIDACSSGAMDNTAKAIAGTMDLPRHTGVVTVYRGKYRVQLLWKTMVGGNHYSHNHLGIRARCCLATG